MYYLTFEYPHFNIISAVVTHIFIIFANRIKFKSLQLTKR